jgi:hypothetical protein
MGLDLLSPPTRDVGLAHVARGLDGRDKLEDDVSDTDNANDTTSNLADDGCAKEKGADEDVEDTTADKGEQERSVSRNLGRDLELEQSDRKTKDDHVHGDNDRLKIESEDVNHTANDGDGGNGQVDNAKDVGELHCCFLERG